MTRQEDFGLLIEWSGALSAQAVSLYAGPSPDRIDYDRPIARKVTGGRFQFQDGDNRGPVYFALLPDHGGGEATLVSSRRIFLEGALNFRDLGGYETGTGQRVRWGRVFRSDALSRLTAGDQQMLMQIGLKTVCDFRSLSEVKRAPNLLPENSGISNLHMPVVSHAIDTVAALEQLKKGDAGWLTESFMREGYITNLEKFGPTWAAALTCLAKVENRPLVFHCTAGKDRTGSFAAILLLLLGIPEETIRWDHQLSNRYLADFTEQLYVYFEGYGVRREQIRSYLTAPEDAIDALLNHLRDRYGDVDHYLIDRCGLKQDVIQTLRQDLLL